MFGIVKNLLCAISQTFYKPTDVKFSLYLLTLNKGFLRGQVGCQNQTVVKWKKEIGFY